jgi:hypothetical protein
VIHRMHHDEKGVALVVAIMVSFVVFLLSVAVINQAINNVENSAADRTRLTSVNAAEAGLNWFFNHFEKTAVGSLRTAPYSETVGSGPNQVSFTATPTYYSDPAGTTLYSGAYTSGDPPKSVKIASVGTSSDGTQRRMESFIALEAVYGGLQGAMIANSSTTFSNNFTVNGNNGNDGDVVVMTGNFSAPSGLESVHGSLTVVNGTASIGTNLHLYGNVWAKNSVTVNHPQAQVDGYGRSSTAGVTVTSGHVSGNAYYCTGSAPGSGVAGSKINECAAAPPSLPFPQIKYLSSAWTDKGYYIYDVPDTGNECTNARTYVEGTGAGTFDSGAGVPSGYTGVVVYISGTCSYTSTNNATITLGKNLAIVTNGGFNLSQRSNWNGSGATRNLYFFSAWPASGSPTCPTQDISVGNNTGFNTLVQVSVYSGCVVTMNNNNSSFLGQVVGTTLSVGNNFNMSYRPVLIPGANITSFEEDLAYVREVVNP